MKITLCISLVLALFALALPSYGEEQEELSVPQKARVRAIVAQCRTLVERRMSSIEATARRAGQQPRYLIRELDGTDRIVTRDEFSYNAVLDCTILGVANDPLLAPALVGPPPGLQRM